MLKNKIQVLRPQEQKENLKKSEQTEYSDQKENTKSRKKRRG